MSVSILKSEIWITCPKEEEETVFQSNKKINIIDYEKIMQKYFGEHISKLQRKYFEMCVSKNIIKPHTIHKIIFGCYVLAHKFCEEVKDCYNLKNLCKIGAVTPKECLRIERELLKILEWKLYQ